MIRYIPIDEADFARPDEAIIRESVPLGVRRGDLTKTFAIRANREQRQRRERGSAVFSAVYSGIGTRDNIGIIGQSVCRFFAWVSFAVTT